MGGAWEARGNVTPSAEFNFHADPEAARVVVERFAGLCGATYVVPWETCHENLISQVGRARRDISHTHTHTHTPGY